MDRAGWHTTANLDMPNNITPILLPSRAPELNPVESIWQYMRANWLSNRVFETYDAIVDTAMRGMAKAHRATRHNHINRDARVGTCRPILMTVGIIEKI
jgi:transposase